MTALQSLAAEDPRLSAVVKRVVQEWVPDEPPLTVAFGEIGRAIARYWNELGDNVRRRLFARIEEAATSNDEALATAVTTGLLESLVGTSDHEPGLWPQISELLGPVSRHHANSWREF